MWKKVFLVPALQDVVDIKNKAFDMLYNDA